MGKKPVKAIDGENEDLIGGGFDFLSLWGADKGPGSNAGFVGM
jgi:hypothetical protein